MNQPKVLKNLKILIYGNDAMSQKIQKAVALKRGQRITKQKIGHIINMIHNLTQSIVSYKLRQTKDGRWNLTFQGAKFSDFQGFIVDIQGASDSKVYNNISAICDMAQDFIKSTFPDCKVINSFEEEFVGHVETAVRELGYLNFKVQRLKVYPSIAKKANVIQISVNQGNIARIESSIVKNESSFADTKSMQLLGHIDPGQIFRPSKIKEALMKMYKRLFLQNLNNILITPQFEIVDEEWIRVIFTIEDKMPLRINSISIQDNNSVKTSEILRVLPFREGDTISKEALGFAENKIKSIFEIPGVEVSAEPNPDNTVDVKILMNEEESVLKKFFHIFSLDIGNKSSINLKFCNMFGYPISFEGRGYLDLFSYNNQFNNEFPFLKYILGHRINRDFEDVFNAGALDLLDRLSFDFGLKHNVDEGIYRKLKLRSACSVSTFDPEKVSDQNRDFGSHLKYQLGKIFCGSNLESNKRPGYLINWEGKFGFDFGFKDGSIGLSYSRSRTKLFIKRNVSLSEEIRENIGINFAESSDKINKYVGCRNTAKLSFKHAKKFQNNFVDIKTKLKTDFGFSKLPFGKGQGAITFSKDHLFFDRFKAKLSLRGGKILGKPSLFEYFGCSEIHPYIDGSFGPYSEALGQDIGGKWYGCIDLGGRYTIFKGMYLNLSTYGKLGAFNLSDSGGLVPNDAYSLRPFGALGFKVKITDFPIKFRFGIRSILRNQGQNEWLNPIYFNLSI